MEGFWVEGIKDKFYVRKSNLVCFKDYFDSIVGEGWGVEIGGWRIDRG